MQNLKLLPICLLSTFLLISCGSDRAPSTSKLKKTNQSRTNSINASKQVKSSSLDATYPILTVQHRLNFSNNDKVFVYESTSDEKEYLIFNMDNVLFSNNKKSAGRIDINLADGSCEGYAQFDLREKGITHSDDFKSLERSGSVKVYNIYTKSEYHQHAEKVYFKKGKSSLEKLKFPRTDIDLYPLFSISAKVGCEQVQELMNSKNQSEYINLNIGEVCMVIRGKDNDKKTSLTKEHCVDIEIDLPTEDIFIYDNQ